MGKVLIACEFSGRVRNAFVKKGHSVTSVDLLPSLDNSPDHIVADVLPFLEKNWDLVIAHPPCTRLCNSGVRWLHERKLWEELKEACEFFIACLNANSERIAVENPIMHKYAMEQIRVPYSFSCQPWQFGDNVKKRTCFWLKGLNNLIPTSSLDGSSAIAECHLTGPSKDRGYLRSITPSGLATAMADQWGIF